MIGLRLVERGPVVCRSAAAPGSGCGESGGEYTVLFRVNIPEPTSPEIRTVVTSATLRLWRRRHGRGHRPHADSPTDDIVLVTVYQLNDDQWRHPANNNGTRVQLVSF